MGGDTIESFATAFVLCSSVARCHAGCPQPRSQGYDNKHRHTRSRGPPAHQNATRLLTTSSGKNSAQPEWCVM